jgi:hypothetical protein
MPRYLVVDGSASSCRGESQGAIPFIVAEIKIGLAAIGKDEALPMPGQSASVNAFTIVV